MSASRAYLHNLILFPGYAFSGRATFADDSEMDPYMATYMSTPEDEAGPRRRYYGPKEISEVSADDLRRAIAPRCTTADERLLQLSVHTYHTVKIQRLLAVLAGVAR